MSAERTLRIGIVCPYSVGQPGGVQNHVLGLASQLLRMGHRPQILAPGRLPAHLADDRLRAIFASAGSGIPVPYNGSVARVNLGPGPAQRVRAWLAGHDFDVVHLHEPISPSVSLLALRSAITPIVATFHCAVRESAALDLAGRMFLGLARRIDHAIAVSPTAQAVVQRHLGLAPVIIPNGIAAAQFAGPRPANRVPRITLLGRLDEQRKGLGCFLRAWPLISRARPDVEVVVAGPGRRKLPPGIRRTGWISDPERAELLRSTDIFVAPNTDRESFGLVLVEAMAAGSRIVSSELAAFTDVLTGPDGQRLGWTFPPGDHLALADQVLAALEAPTSEPTRQHGACFDWSVIAPQIAEVYQQAAIPGYPSTASGVRQRSSTTVDPATVDPATVDQAGADFATPAGSAR